MKRKRKPKIKYGWLVLGVCLLALIQKEWKLEWKQNPAKASEKNMVAYIDQYTPLAIRERAQHGIPASITLAQGLLESQAGKSVLAIKTNNHFGIKCFLNTCPKGHCTNHPDDTHKDFFVIYENPVESYEAHSNFLKKERYLPLYQLPISDYRGWANGLAKAGYATDPLYGQKLISIIEKYQLQKLDH
jgi:flagellum-specific peptidoglycan hydrolase FlgJ